MHAHESRAVLDTLGRLQDACLLPIIDFGTSMDKKSSR